MSGAKKLVKGGTVITLDTSLGDFEQADILIEGSKIVDVRPNIEAEDAEVIDAREKIVIPGFVETHRHVWQGLFRQIGGDYSVGQYFMVVMRTTGPKYRPEDLHIANLHGRLEALNSGVTTMLDWCHLVNTPEHADAAIAGLGEVRGRSIFAYGAGNPGWRSLPMARSEVMTSDDVRRVRQQYFASDDGLITMAMGSRGPEFSTMDVTEHDFKLARQLGLRITVHVGVGDFGLMYPSIDLLHERGLLGPDTTYVHCSTCTDAHIKKIADTGGSASVSALLEPMFGLGNPPTNKLLRHGVRTSLSIDDSGGVGGDLFSTMHATLAFARSDQYRLAQEAGGTQEPKLMSCREVLELATIEGARACGLEDRVGTISIGKEADIVLIDGSGINMSPVLHPIAAVVLAASAADVHTVLVAGEVVKQNGKFVGIDLKAVLDKVRASRTYVAKASGIPEYAIDWEFSKLGLA